MPEDEVTRPAVFGFKGAEVPRVKFATLDGRTVSDSQQPGMVPVHHLLRLILMDDLDRTKRLDVSELEGVVINDRVFVPQRFDLKDGS